MCVGDASRLARCGREVEQPMLAIGNTASASSRYRFRVSMAISSVDGKSTTLNEDGFRWWKTARSEAAYRYSRRVVQAPVVEERFEPLELVAVSLLVHRQDMRRPDGCPSLPSPHHPKRNEIADHHKTDTCHPVNDHHPKGLVHPAVTNADSRNRAGILAMLQHPSFHHLPAVCRWHSTARLIEKSVMQPRVVLWQSEVAPNHSER